MKWPAYKLGEHQLFDHTMKLLILRFLETTNCNQHTVLLPFIIRGASLITLVPRLLEPINCMGKFLKV